MKDRKNPYSAAELEIIRFNVDDVVTASLPNIEEGGEDWNDNSNGSTTGGEESSWG